MSDIKWIKIVTDIFEDEKILLIEDMPNADSILIVWLKLLCFAGKQNNSGVFTFNDKIPYTSKMFSKIFRRKEKLIELSFKTFEEFGMIEIVENVITIPNWGKHQSEDMLQDRRDYMRGYMEKYRDKQKLLTKCKTNSKVNSKANVNLQEEEEDKEVDNTPLSPEGNDANSNLNIFVGKSFSLEIKSKVLEWFEYKKERRQSYKPRGLTSFLTEIENKTKIYKESDIINLINECMANMWVGIIWDRLKGKEKIQQISNNSIFEERGELN